MIEANSLAGFNHLHHLGTQAAGTTFTIQGHQNQTGGAGHISLIGRYTGLLIETIRLVEKLAAMVSPLFTTTGYCGLGCLGRRAWTGRNGRDWARESKGCQGVSRGKEKQSSR